ncbi:MAG: phosphoribosylglycinamide formyltransferase, partial [Microcoleus sp. PH2017_04_SCI_O_A]|nr:phosphoribosylglycinamide formyltransferase [Microcoleus sp. PH2017_04_SCI_O_A]
MTVDLVSVNSTACLISPEIAFPAIDPTHPPLKLGVLASGSGSNFEVIAEAIQ